MLRQNMRAFTLVELIVVITIVGILSTVGFVSYSGYLTGARDSNRISQMTRLSDSLQVYSTTKSLPLPDNNIQITASGELVAYQGEVGVDVLETIDYTNGGKDPRDDSFFTYYLTRDRASSQLLTFMEEENSVIGYDSLFNTTHAVDFRDRFPKVYGRKLWVLTQVDTNTPVQDVNGVTTLDLVTETATYVAHISNEEQIEWDGTELRAIIPNASCNRVKQTGGASWNGIYTINPGGSWDTEVYCDMETAGGGWTLIARSVNSETITWGTATWNSSDNDTAFVYGDISTIPYSQAMIASYDTNKSITGSSSASITPPLSSFSEGTHTLWSSWISWGTLTGDGMMFVK